MLLKVYDSKKHQEVVAGEILGETFIKTVKKNHYMGKYHGYGISEEIFRILIDKGIRNIIENPELLTP